MSPSAFIFVSAMDLHPASCYPRWIFCLHWMKIWRLLQLGKTFQGLWHNKFFAPLSTWEGGNFDSTPAHQKQRVLGWAVSPAVAIEPAPSFTLALFCGKKSQKRWKNFRPLSVWMGLRVFEDFYLKLGNAVLQNPQKVESGFKFSGISSALCTCPHHKTVQYNFPNIQFISSKASQYLIFNFNLRPKPSGLAAC